MELMSMFPLKWDFFHYANLFVPCSIFRNFPRWARNNPISWLPIGAPDNDDFHFHVFFFKFSSSTNALLNISPASFIRNLGLQWQQLCQGIEQRRRSNPGEPISYQFSKKKNFLIKFYFTHSEVPVLPLSNSQGQPFFLNLKMLFVELFFALFLWMPFWTIKVFCLN